MDIAKGEWQEAEGDKRAGDQNTLYTCMKSGQFNQENSAACQHICIKVRATIREAYSNKHLH